MKKIFVLFIFILFCSFVLAQVPTPTPTPTPTPGPTPEPTPQPQPQPQPEPVPCPDDGEQITPVREVARTETYVIDSQSYTINNAQAEDGTTTVGGTMYRENTVTITYYEDGGVDVHQSVNVVGDFNVNAYATDPNAPYNPDENAGIEFTSAGALGSRTDTIISLNDASELQNLDLSDLTNNRDYAYLSTRVDVGPYDFSIYARGQITEDNVSLGARASASTSGLGITTTINQPIGSLPAFFMDGDYIYSLEGSFNFVPNAGASYGAMFASTMYDARFALELNSLGTYAFNTTYSNMPGRLTLAEIMTRAGVANPNMPSNPSDGVYEAYSELLDRYNGDVTQAQATLERALEAAIAEYEAAQASGSTDSEDTDGCVTIPDDNGNPINV